MSAKERILKMLKDNVGSIVGRDLLSQAANTHDWQRSIRTLRSEGWDITSVRQGYILNNTTQNPISNFRKSINNKLRYEVLQRDNSQCQRCGNMVKDGVKLEVDHKIPVSWGGSNDRENLWTLCNDCNGGKKNLFSDLNEELMKEVFKETNGYKKIKKIFELSPNIIIEPSTLDVISGIRDWERTLRLIRKKENMNIGWIYPSEEYPKGGYKYEKN